MTLDQVKGLYADWARPTAIYGVTGAVILAVAQGRDAGALGALLAGLGVLYGARAAENVGVAKAGVAQGVTP